MTAIRTPDGYLVSAIVNGRYVKRQYAGVTERQALRLFRTFTCETMRSYAP